MIVGRRPETALVLLVTAAGIGCGGPVLFFPGGSLRGDVVSDPPTDWPFADSGFLDLEVRPDDPYSVTIHYVVREGDLYIDPAEGRTWHRYLREDDRVRVRFRSDERVYPLRAVLAGRPGETPGFDPDRYVYRLVPR